MTSGPPAPSPRRAAEPQPNSGPNAHQSLNREDGRRGACKIPRCPLCRHQNQFFASAPPVGPSEIYAGDPLPSIPAATPHLRARVEDLHGDLLRGWVRAPGHAGLLDHGEEPPLRPPARHSRAPSAHGREAVGGDSSAAQPAAARVTQPGLRLPPSCLAPLLALSPLPPPPLKAQHLPRPLPGSLLPPRLRPSQPLRSSRAQTMGAPRRPGVRAAG